MTTETIKIGKVELILKGNWNKGEKGSYLQPPQAPQFETEEVFYKDMEISDLIEAFNLTNRIDEEISKQL